MKKSLMLGLVLLLSLGFAGLASAHVTVQPKEVPAGSYQVFTVRVPSEKDSATTQVKVAIPDNVNVSRFEPKADWTYEIEKGAEDKIVSVTWKATGSGLGATEFGEFRMQGKVADDAKELVWKAYQTYADGEVVEWTGAADADKPASVTAVTAATGDGHGDGHGASGGAAASDETDSGRDALTLSLAIAGLAAGVLALLIALFRKRA
ncbi:YcnI family copper-binding membrane protein [Cohnella cholangitidis]|uniref:YcnI family protein n=1 Tax=Cohnella cholangitidis TaxID=2598458 RepID=A0A7G5C2M3_9BACL|nr:YcnI family protein [Cohnella cholangitidis]QMV43457.1 YcnI family protein [Cohnella cholangitidis]